MRGEEVIRVAVVASPAHEQQVVLAGLGAADQLAPFDHANLGVDAHLGQIRLQQLRAEAGVGIEQAAAGAGPDGGLETLCQTSLGQQGAGLVWRMRIAGQFAGVAPGVRRVRAIGRLGAALEHGLDVAGLVEGQVDRLAHLRFVQWWMLAVDADEGGHERGGLCAFQLGVAGDGLHVLRFRRQSDLAFATAQLLQAHVAVWGDGEDHPVHARLAGEILRVGAVAHHGILLETLEGERTAADGRAVELLRGAGGHQLVGVFGGIDRSEAHAQGGEEGRIAAVQGDAYAVRIRRLDLGDQAWPLHRLGMWITAGSDRVPGVLLVEHALEAEQHVPGIESAAGREVGAVVKLHVVAQGEVVDQAVGGDRPAARQARQQFALLGVELHQAVHQHVGRGIGGGQRVVLHHVETLRAGFGAYAEGGGLGQDRGAQ